MLFELTLGALAIGHFDPEFARAFVHASFEFAMRDLQVAVARLDLAQHLVESVGQVSDFVLTAFRGAQ